MSVVRTIKCHKGALLLLTSLGLFVGALALATVPTYAVPRSEVGGGGVGTIPASGTAIPSGHATPLPQATATPQCCIGYEQTAEDCHDGKDNDCDGYFDAPDSILRPPDKDPDPGCCPDDFDGCTYPVIVNGSCQNMPISDCVHCLFPSDCDDLVPGTLNLCVSGRCIFQRIP